MLSNKFSILPIEEDYFSTSSKKYTALDDIKKYYKDHVAKRLEIFQKYDDLINEISYLEYTAYAGDGYIKEVILPNLNALLNFNSMTDQNIFDYFGNNVRSFQSCVDSVFSEVDYVLDNYHF